MGGILLQTQTPEEQFILQILMQGGHGDERVLLSWGKMFLALKKSGLADNLGEYNEQYQKSIKLFEKYDESFLDEKAFKKGLAALIKKDLVKKTGKYNEYCLADTHKWVFHNKQQEVFFAGNDLEHEPLQYVRSRVQNFCSMLNIEQEQTEEIIIAVTEAAENSVKYSNEYTFVVDHGIRGAEYHVAFFNSISEINLNDEISRGKFSEEASLMRGVLVMSKLLDDIDIERNNEKSRVEFSGFKRLRFSTSAVN